MDDTNIIHVTITPSDWDKRIGGFRCSALSLPSAEIKDIFVSGGRINPDDYNISDDRQYIRWNGEKPTKQVVVEIRITKELSTRELTLKWKKAAILLPIIASIASPIFIRVIVPDENHVPCYKAAGWPKGAWSISGRVTNGPSAESAAELIFESPLGGSIRTDEKGARVADFKISNELVPNNSVNYEAWDSTGYKSYFRGVVSSNGCFIKGNWDDTEGRRGYYNLFWRERDKYWVREK